MKVYAVSDVHTDYPENLSWVDVLCAKRSSPTDDCLIVAGDVADDTTVFRKTFQRLRESYKHVFFVAGNHELWVRKAERQRYDSLGKLHHLKEICDELGVLYTPAQLPNGVWIVPLWSWYHASFDKEPDIPGSLPIEKIMMDFHACSWESKAGLRASGDDSLAKHFDEMNEPDFSNAIAEIEHQRNSALLEDREPPAVISFSHFLPLQVCVLCSIALA